MIDGAEAACDGGLLLIATTNHPETIDDARVEAGPFPTDHSTPETGGGKTYEVASDYLEHARGEDLGQSEWLWDR